MTTNTTASPGFSPETLIERSRHEANGIAIRYLGQVGFLLQHRGLTIAIDPYLTDSVDRLTEFKSDFWVRAYPPPVDPRAMKKIDLVLCTHDHMDHTDSETLAAIAAASPECRFAGPRQSVDVMIRAGIASDRVVVLNEGQPFAFRDAVVEPVAVAHEEYETDAGGYHRYLGYLLHWGGMTLFHAGDTVATPRLAETLSRHSIDVGFLPVNGRDEARHQLGIIGNLDTAEAANFAADQGFKLVVPTHYDLYPNNGAALADFVTTWEQRPVSQRPKLKAFLPGEQIVYQKPGACRELAVVVGAGKTGRGFLARLLGKSRYEVAFVDQSENLVRRLNEDGAYTIHFFGGERTPWRIEGINAAVAGSEEALQWMSRAAVVFISIGETNVPGLIPALTRVLDLRRANGYPKLHILVCENGASPADPLLHAFAERAGEIEIAEAAIFCSTIELPGTRLDIQSETCDELPYDVERLVEFPAFAGMKPVANFPTLLRRKIYTYNCFSACIAYLGAYKGYQWYSDAAQDAEIGAVLDRIAEPLNQAIALTFNVDIEEQRLFSAAALRKFRDASIRDDIARNARAVARKLAPSDRLIKPAHLIIENGGSIEALSLVIAAALLYSGPNEKAIQAELAEKPVEQVLARISDCPADGAINRSVSRYYRMLKTGTGKSLLEILDTKD